MCGKDVLKMKKVQRMATELIRPCLVEEDLNQLVVQPSKSRAAGCPNDQKFGRQKEKCKTG